MANKYEPNFTVIPNVFLDEWLPRLDSAQVKVLIVICRFTYGIIPMPEQIRVADICTAADMKWDKVSRVCAELANIGVIHDCGKASFRLRFELGEIK